MGQGSLLRMLALGLLLCGASGAVWSQQSSTSNLGDHAFEAPRPSPTQPETGKGPSKKGAALPTLHLEGMKLPWWARDPAGTAGPPAQNFTAQLAFQTRQRNTMRKMLGANRWRRFEAARFDLEMDSRASAGSLRFDKERYGEVEDVVRDTFFELFKESAEDTLRIDAFVDRTLTKLKPKNFDRIRKVGDFGASGGAKARQGLGFSASPRLHLGSNPQLGAKLGLSGFRSPFGSRLTVRLQHGLRETDSAIKFLMENEERRLYFEIAEREYHGHYLKLGVYWSY